MNFMNRRISTVLAILIAGGSLMMSCHGDGSKSKKDDFAIPDLSVRTIMSDTNYFSTLSICYRGKIKRLKKTITWCPTARPSELWT